MNTHSAWKRLAAAARRAEVDTGDVAAPFGFATRIAALAMTDHRMPSLVQRLSLRALGIAGLLMAACVALNLGPILRTLDDETMGLASDPAAFHLGELS